LDYLSWGHVPSLVTGLLYMIYDIEDFANHL
jgi:hypothetical protein